MQESGLSLVAYQSSLFFETPEQIYTRVFRELRPRTAPPAVEIEFRRYVDAHASIRLESGRLLVRISDVLEGAPSLIIESLAYILIGKLYRKPVPRLYSHRYRLYLNRRDVRRQLHLVRQIRGRKYVSGPAGRHHNLDSVFEELNQRYFQGLLGRPQLGWSRALSRSLLGHFDPSHNAIIISRIFDTPSAPRLALEYVMFHEMLHLRYPVDHQHSRRRVHTREFRQAEKSFELLKEARDLLKRL